MTDPTPKPAEPVLSKNLAFGAIALIVVLGVVGVVLLHLFRPDASATFIQTIVTFAGILTVAITTIYGLGKLGDRVEVVQRQTNGNLAMRDRIIAEKDAQIAALHVEKVELAKQLPPTA
ncbi:hypothetical protein SAMN04487788_1949 [Microbacterium testaceum StLB037]|uniref:Uncharacterized protein n=1 Tax=Microbacterium testaceum (strain StLB037) TaxID=979556 RepID=A0A1H0PS43_MICTS|nr:hypothetical protein [Microbacterium testaceum]SDP07366.1 hypothetical protein SAMN04487788_1949 [Microbacterium testaceum StLB037]